MAAYIHMTAKEVLEAVAAMPSEEWMRIQSGIAEMIVSRLSDEETAEIHEALTEAETQFAKGKGVGGQEVRRLFGLE